MKRTFSVIIALFLILGLRLVAYGGDTLKKAGPSPTPIGDPVAGEQLIRTATPPPTLSGASIAEEKIFEDDALSPTSAGEKLFAEMTPSPTPAGDPVAGEKLFASACKVCHRKDVIRNDFVAGKTDQELVEFIKVGGAPGEPRVMLPKGGKPSLTDQNLYNIVAYLRTMPE